MGARVNHSNVAATFDYCDEGGITFLVEEYIEGRDLGARLSKDFFFLDPALAGHVMHHVARALHEAHRVDICHRDLKPSNIMVSEGYDLQVLKLTDFGIAKLAEQQIGEEMESFENDPETLTTSDTLLGAVPYMAPECWSDWTHSGQPMDIWALGCIGYQLLTGQPPFGTGRRAIANVTKAENAGKVDLVKPTWFGLHASTLKLENELWNVIVDCIQIDSSSRPSASEVIQKCDALCYSVGKRSTGVISTYPYKYATGGIGQCGFITDDNSSQSLFFNKEDFFSINPPAVKKKVCYVPYPGAPNPRLSPVLEIR